MIKIETVSISGWGGALAGMRLPMGSKCDSVDSEGKYIGMGDKDHDLALRLATAGPDHGKYLRMVQVQAKITAPVYWWREMDQYKVGTVTNSGSMMHTGTRRSYNLDGFSFEDVQEIDKDFAIQILEQLRSYVNAYNETKDPIYFRALRQLMPMGLNYTEMWCGNYAVLRNIYRQRKHHKLTEWSGPVGFCRWIEGLPYSELITESKRCKMQEVFDYMLKECNQ